MFGEVDEASDMEKDKGKWYSEGLETDRWRGHDRWVWLVCLCVVVSPRPRRQDGDKILLPQNGQRQKAVCVGLCCVRASALVCTQVHQALERRDRRKKIYEKNLTTKLLLQKATGH